MKLSELLGALGIRSADRIHEGCEDLTPTSTLDKCTHESLLFVIKRLSGEYTAEAKKINKRMPYAVICDVDYPTDRLRVPYIIVDDVRTALAYACSLHYGIDYAGMKIIGITGTNGKTTTATLLHGILTACGIKAGQIGTGIIRSGEVELADNATTMTTPDPERLYRILGDMQKDGCTHVVMEVSSHAIALGKVAPITFDLGIFTNLSHEHMDFHKTPEDYYMTKRRLFESCRVAIFNIDDGYGERAYSEMSGKKLSVGIVNQGDIYATDIVFEGVRGSEFFYRRGSLIFKAKLRLPGSFNIYNALLAMSAAIELGMKPKDVKHALFSIKGVEGRMELIHSEPSVVIDYAHTPYAVESALRALRATVGGGRLIAVLGSGGNRDRSKRPLMANAASRYADITVLTEDNSRGEMTEAIIDDMKVGLLEGREHIEIPRREDAIRHALSIANESDTVAIIGKGHERYIIDGKGYRSFDEREIVKSFFEGISNEN
ncbi:MAG: UDP-N-acetylmuramoyl-L-alanyl-D-glutamate--2,6-diaminopimelate ligase [Clostridia bacterium]|nr:UDP-N-acetylmuramoyl-L-alanyl-D-glutamate--2,6-diaminopimelate ligase [Clostridia bacterium]